MPLATRFFPLLLAALVAIAVLAGSSQLQRDVREDSAAETALSLQTVLRTTHEALRTRLAHHTSTMAVWAQTPSLQELVLELAATDPDPAALRSAPAQARLRDWFARVETATGYRRLAVIGPGNTILAASTERDIGMRIPGGEQAEFLQRVWGGKASFSLPQPGKEDLERRNWLFAGTPVREDGGRVAAILALSIDLEQDLGRLLEQGRVGLTGETYAFDAQLRLLSRSRFEDTLRAAGLLGEGVSSVLRVSLRDPGVDLTAGEVAALPRDSQPPTRMAAAALAGEDGVDIGGYRDYRGVPVAGAWLWDEVLDIGLATEQDVAEAFASAERTVRAIRIATGLLLALVALSCFGYWIYRDARRARIALEDYRIRLEEIVAERTAELQRSKDELEAYSHSMAHDLRQPLRGITSFSQILREEAAGQLDVSQLEMLDRIAAAGRKMSELIDSMLELARVSRTSLHPEEIDLGELCRRVDAGLAAQEPGRRVQLEIEPGLVVRADPRLAELALRELLGNARKFSACRESARIEVGARDGAQGREFFVRDNGEGIDMRFAEQLFKPFTRLHDDPARSGRGIGLAIARRAIARHGGQLRAESAPGQGATFLFTLPATGAVAGSR